MTAPNSSIFFIVYSTKNKFFLTALFFPSIIVYLFEEVRYYDCVKYTLSYFYYIIFKLTRIKFK